MPSLNFQKIAEMTGGECIAGHDLVASSYIIDSRESKPGACFFAIQGDRLDGHAFLAQALEQCAGAVVREVPETIPQGKGIVRVADTTEALQKLARAIRHEKNFTLIGVTGSAGKTTTKEMIATLIEAERPTWKSWGNFNNHIGCPLCLANTPENAAVVVSEMGMNHAGEIAALARLTDPDIGVYTNIQPVHLEFFGTIEKIAAAKRELLENVKPGGSIVVNMDNEQIRRIIKGFEGRIITYAVETEDVDYRAVEIEDRALRGTDFTLRGEGGDRRFTLSLPGVHNLENLLAAIATARLVGISWEGIERGIAALKPAYHRGVIVEWNGATLYDDTYNSNPYAAGRALELLAKATDAKRRIAFLGDMLELGPEELTFHREVGEKVPSNVDVLIGIGRRSKSLLEGAEAAGFAKDRLHHFEDSEAASVFAKNLIRPGDFVLLKGSRGIGLDRIITSLEGTR